MVMCPSSSHSKSCPKSWPGSRKRSNHCGPSPPVSCWAAGARAPPVLSKSGQSSWASSRRSASSRGL
eukprot:11088621-Alexandrium_andersonii.AAC.1